jgi:hypothetical protein
MREAAAPPLAVPDRLRLPFLFDAARLQAELSRLPASAWVPHFNPRDHEGEWSGVALRSTDGAASRLQPGSPTRDGFQDTPLLEGLPALREVLATFQCPVGAARLLKLAPGARILEHTDYNLGFDDGEVRLHVPITTHPNVAFFLAGQRVALQPGECWYFDFNLPHRVDNPTGTDRVHLVVDCRVDEWLRAVFAEAMGTPRSRMP